MSAQAHQEGALEHLGRPPAAASAGGEGASDSPPLRLVVVDDHTLVREGTVEFLEQDPTLSVVGQASTGEEAVGLICALNPDLVLVDVELPGISGIEVVRAVRQQAPAVRFIVLSAYDDHAYVVEALGAGVSGYLLKTVSRRELASAVHMVATGRVVLDEAVSRRLVGKGEPGPGSVAGLTRRETDVLFLIARGRSNKQIAGELGLGLRTVESHVSNLLTKLGLASRTEAALYAVNHQILPSTSERSSR